MGINLSKFDYVIFSKRNKLKVGHWGTILLGIILSQSNLSHFLAITELLCEILKSEGIKIEKTEILYNFRAGKKQEDTVRPLVVKLSSKQLKDSILENGRTIYLNKAVSVAPDLTKIQQHKRNELIDEAKDKTSNREWI